MTLFSSIVAFHISLSRLVMLQGLSVKLSEACKTIVVLTVARFSTYVLNYDAKSFPFVGSCGDNCGVFITAKYQI